MSYKYKERYDELNKLSEENITKYIDKCEAEIKTLMTFKEENDALLYNILNNMFFRQWKKSRTQDGMYVDRKELLAYFNNMNTLRENITLTKQTAPTNIVVSGIVKSSDFTSLYNLLADTKTNDPLPPTSENGGQGVAPDWSITTGELGEGSRISATTKANIDASITGWLQYTRTVSMLDKSNGNTQSFSQTANSNGNTQSNTETVKTNGYSDVNSNTTKSNDTNSNGTCSNGTNTLYCG